jgi:hypothetical protein
LQTKYHVTKILTNRNREQMLNKARIWRRRTTHYIRILVLTKQKLH